MAKREKERHYIRKHINNKYEGYQLVIPASDTKELIYFAHGKDVDKLREIRDKILSQPHTEADILRYKEQYRNKEVVGIQTTRRSCKGPDRYIYKERGKYVVKRAIRDGDKQRIIRYDTSINTLEEAREIRDWWEENGWDWNAIDLY